MLGMEDAEEGRCCVGEDVGEEKMLGMEDAGEGKMLRKR